jgi:hypothetical protein
MTTFAPSPPPDWQQTELFPTVSAAASHARTSASPGVAPALVASVPAYGSSISASSGKSRRAGSSSKTSQPFALADWTLCSGASLRSGMMRNGILSPLPPSALLIRETAYGYWPTPRSEDGESTGMSAARLATREADNLPTAVKMWPTAAARDYRAPNNPNGASRLSRPPTSGEQLPNAVGGVLHPEWVEKLMGFDAGWTELDQWKPGKATRRAPSAGASRTGGPGSRR